MEQQVYKPPEKVLDELQGRGWNSIAFAAAEMASLSGVGSAVKLEGRCESHSPKENLGLLLQMVFRGCVEGKEDERKGQGRGSRTGSFLLLPYKLCFSPLPPFTSSHLSRFALEYCHSGAKRVPRDCVDHSPKAFCIFLSTCNNLQYHLSIGSTDGFRQRFD